MTDSNNLTASSSGSRESDESGSLHAKKKHVGYSPDAFLTSTYRQEHARLRECCEEVVERAAHLTDLHKSEIAIVEVENQRLLRELRSFQAYTGFSTQLPSDKQTSSGPCFSNENGREYNSEESDGFYKAPKSLGAMNGHGTDGQMSDGDDWAVDDALDSKEMHLAPLPFSVFDHPSAPRQDKSQEVEPLVDWLRQTAAEEPSSPHVAVAEPVSKFANQISPQPTPIVTSNMLDVDGSREVLLSDGRRSSVKRVSVSHVLITPSLDDPVSVSLAGTSKDTDDTVTLLPRMVNWDEGVESQASVPARKQETDVEDGHSDVLESSPRKQTTPRKERDESPRRHRTGLDNDVVQHTSSDGKRNSNSRRRRISNDSIRASDKGVLHDVMIRSRATGSGMFSEPFKMSKAFNATRLSEYGLEHQENNDCRAFVMQCTMQGMEGEDVAKEELRKLSFLHQAMHPSSRFRLVWESFGAILLGLDVIMVPMQPFDMDRTGFLTVTSWMILYYWSLDIILSFCCGYHTPEGGIVFTWIKIAAKYIKGWFLPDLLLVSMDWCLVIVGVAGGRNYWDAMESDGGGGENLALLRAGKVVKVLRLFRLLRVMKMSNSSFFFVVQDKFESERLYVMANLCKNIVFLLTLNHFIACVWYWVGSQKVDGWDNWVTHYRMNEKPWYWAYLTSVHWSLAQFANGEIIIEPQNIPERLVAIAVLLLSTILFSAFIGIVGNTIGQLIEQSASQRRAKFVLRLYLREHHISRHLKMRVHRYACFLDASINKRIAHQNVGLFSRLSRPLQVELLTELYTKHLVAHPLFKFLATRYLTTVRLMCCTAIREVQLSRSDILFGLGESVYEMSLVITGQLDYWLKNGEDTTHRLIEGDKGEWFCEAVLWTENWLTHGGMAAKTECLLVSISSEKFQEIVAQNRASAFWLLSEYATMFVDDLNDRALSHEHPVSDCDQFLDSQRQWLEKQNKTLHRQPPAPIQALAPDLPLFGNKLSTRMGSRFSGGKFRASVPTSGGLCSHTTSS